MRDERMKRWRDRNWPGRGASRGLSQGGHDVGGFVFIGVGGARRNPMLVSLSD